MHVKERKHVADWECARNLHTESHKFKRLVLEDVYIFYNLNCVMDANCVIGIEGKVYAKEIRRLASTI